MTSFASVNGPSVTVILPLSNRTRAPSAEGRHPSVARSSPLFIILAMSAFMRSMNSSDGDSFDSAPFQIDRNRIICSLSLTGDAQIAESLHGLDVAEVLELEELPHLDLAVLEQRVGEAPGPLERFVSLFVWIVDVARDQFLGLVDRSIDARLRGTGEFDPPPLRARLQPVGIEQHTGFRQPFVIVRHRAENFRRRLDACLRASVRLYQNHESHILGSFNRP